MNRSNQQYRWIKAQRKYRNLQKRIATTHDHDLIRRLMIKLEQLKRRLLTMNKKWQVGVAASVMMAWLSASPVQAQFSSPFPLSSLNGNNGFTINGESANDAFGNSVSDAGDVNGDGVNDFIVGTRAVNFGEVSNAGAAYVIFGNSNGFNATLEVSSLDGTNGFIIGGINADDYAGRSVSAAGDINNDGYADVLVGAFEADRTMNDDAGASYVIFGQSSFSASLPLSSLNGTNGFAIPGIGSNDRAAVVSAAGDVNGDTFDDFIIGARNANGYTGAAYVVFGQSASFGASFELSSLNGSNGFAILGTNTDDRFGSAVGSGDFNNDGYSDVAIGAGNAGPYNAGETYVIFGQSAAFSSSINASGLDGSDGFAVTGSEYAAYAGLGGAIGSGDINGDGIDDLLIGAPSAYDQMGINEDTGKTFVVFGASAFGATLQLSSLNANTGFALFGIDGGDYSGYSVSSADINGDGIDDLITSAVYGSPPGSSYVGEAYVVFGKTSGLQDMNLSALDGTNGFILSGIDEYDYAGYSISGLADVNGDGVDDILIGASYAAPGGVSGAGETYVVFGEAPLDTQAPNFEAFTPADNATGVALGANLIIDFDEPVVKGMGDITIKRTSDDGDVEVIDVNSGQVTINNDMVTINPSSDFPTSTGLYVLITVGAFEDLTGNTRGIVNSDTWNFTTTDVCSVPTGLTTNALDNTTATLAWDDVNSGEEYEVEYKIINPPGQPWNTATVNTNTRDITGLTAGELYKFRVRGKCVINEETVYSAYSSDFYFNTTISGCDVPSGLAAGAIDNTSAMLGWNDVNSGPMDEYEVMYRAISPVTGPWQTISSLTNPFTNLSGLTPGTLYKYKVNGTCDLSGTTVTTDYSPDFYFTTTNSGCTVPSGLVATSVDNTSATFSWNDVNVQPTDEYEVMYRAISPVSGPWETVSSLTDPTTNVTGLTPGTLYKYKVNGTCDLSGTSITTAYSSDFYFTTTITGCDVPDGLDATGITATGATLQWNDVNMGAMDEYEVMYRPISPLGPWETVSSLTTNSTTVNTLSASTLYKFKVRGTCDLSGTSVTTTYSPDFYFSTPMMLTLDDATLREQLTEEVEELQINAYPNPSSGMVNLLFEPIEPGTGRLSIYALNGSRVLETEFTDRLDERVDLAASGQGIYLVRIDYNDQVFESRVLIR